MAPYTEFYHHETYKPKREQIFALATLCQHCTLFEELCKCISHFFFMMAVEKIGFDFLGSHLLCYVRNVEDKCSFFVTWLFHKKTCFWKASFHFFVYAFCGIISKVSPKYSGKVLFWGVTALVVIIQNYFSIYVDLLFQGKI